MTTKPRTRRAVLRNAAGLVGLVAFAGVGTASSTAKSQFADEDGNGIPDEGEVVTGAYKSVLAYEGEYGSGAYPQEDWYWDLGDGRVSGTVDSIDELDQDRLTVCEYKVQYRGTYANDPFLDTGWVRNQINCRGYDDNGNYNYNIVHETDPRYTGDRPPAFGGDWEYQTYVVSGVGNQVTRPTSPPGQ
ncbi:hypothetical protein [Haloferax sp. Atlit-4N]|uniref:hypothetical protein n=1 Tax=Haloferax sp. Atlit-4N TaxID=2077206 RepID=UPI001F315C6D|nr:hypothetical protein [Haloferax sp. Atlit-4N]